MTSARGDVEAGTTAGAGARPDLGALRERVAAILGTGTYRLEAPGAAGSRGEGGDGAAPREARESPETVGTARQSARPGARSSTRTDHPMTNPVAKTLAVAGLTEIHADETRGGGSAAGLVLALAADFGASARRPILWISQGFGLGEAGRLYGPGLAAFGFDPGGLVNVETRRLEEAIWAAEEAARSPALACAVLEVRGNPARLSLDGTRRLHVRARAAGVALLLLRQGAEAEPTAAPSRLRVEAGPAAGVPGLGPPGERLIGHPVFSVAVEKSRDGRARRLLLEWNPHEHRLQTLEPRPLPVAALSPPLHGPDPARAARPVLALRRAS